MSVKICKEEEAGGAHVESSQEGHQVNKDKSVMYLLIYVSDWTKLATSADQFRED